MYAVHALFTPDFLCFPNAVFKAMGDTHLFRLLFRACHSTKPIPFAFRIAFILYRSTKTSVKDKSHLWDYFYFSKMEYIVACQAHPALGFLPNAILTVGKILSPDY